MLFLVVWHRSTCFVRVEMNGNKWTGSLAFEAKGGNNEGKIELKNQKKEWKKRKQLPKKKKDYRWRKGWTKEKMEWKNRKKSSKKKKIWNGQKRVRQNERKKKTNEQKSEGMHEIAKVWTKELGKERARKEWQNFGVLFHTILQCFTHTLNVADLFLIRQSRLALRQGMRLHLLRYLWSFPVRHPTETLQTASALALLTRVGSELSPTALELSTRLLNRTAEAVMKDYKGQERTRMPKVSGALSCMKTKESELWHRLLFRLKVMESPETFIEKPRLL